jgi:hypothetical protein
MGQVLKANHVRVEAPMRLSIDGVGMPRGAGVHRPEAHPRVRIAQSDPAYAVLEITCSCGKVVHVRCDYAADPASAAGKPARS